MRESDSSLRMILVSIQEAGRVAAQFRCPTSLGLSKLGDKLKFVGHLFITNGTIAPWPAFSFLCAIREYLGGLCGESLC